MGQFIFHCSIEYLGYIPKRRIIKKETEWWFQIPGLDEGMESVYLHLGKEDSKPRLEVNELYREEIYNEFLRWLPNWGKGFSQVYALNANEELDFLVIEQFCEKANRLSVCSDNREYCQELFQKIIWETGLVGEQYVIPHFMENGKGKTVVLYFSDGGEIKIPYKNIPKESVFIEFGCEEKSKRAVFQKRPDINYYSLFGFLDNTVKSRYNSLVNMGVLNKYRIKNMK